MFNDYVWNLYLEAGGKNVAETFERYLSEEFSNEYTEFIVNLQKSWCPSKFVYDTTRNDLNDLYSDIKEGVCILPEGEYTILSATEELFNEIKQADNLTEQNVFKCFAWSITYFSTLLHIELPGLFIPYHFKYNFNVFEKIAKEFNIELQPLPAKKNYEDRFYYYASICMSLYDFRIEHNMTPYELCAFLYDFAPKFIGGIDSYIVKDLPEPKSAFFIGGSKDDIFYNDSTDTITPWQSNPETRAGDMLVMYLRTPVSAIDSVWRSVSVGFNDPFFYYYRCAYIGKPTSITQVSQKQLQSDNIFKNLPLVKKNMQGINGVELKPSEYNHLLDLANSDIQRLEFVISEDTPDLVNEKDVENKLIKPLISRLGYKENEYTQQMQIEVGNHNFKLIPDFVLLPNPVRGHHSAFAIIEAKYTIPNTKALDEVKVQASSYAIQLRAKYSAIASREKIWVYSAKDDFTNVVFEASWQELNNSDIFSELLKLLGTK